MFGWFSKKDKAATDNPKWGDCRVVRVEHADGRVYFLTERFGWFGQSSGHRYFEWSTLAVERGYGPREFATAELAKRHIDAVLAEEAGRVVVSKTVAWPHDERASLTQEKQT